MSAIGTVPAMRPRALLGASCESNGSKEKTLKSGVVGSRALAGQRLKQADFTFQDPSRARELPRTYLRRIPAPCSSTFVIFRFRLLHPPFLRHFRHARRTKARRPQRAHTIINPAFFTRKSSLLIIAKNIACFLGSYFAEQRTRALPPSCLRACNAWCNV